MTALAQPRYTPAQLDAHRRKKERDARLLAAAHRHQQSSIPRRVFPESLGSWGFTVQAFFPGDRIDPRSMTIVAEVAREFGVPLCDMMGPRRNMTVLLPRHVAMWRLYRECTDLSLPSIGRIMRKDHTTVLNAIQKVEQRIAAGRLLLPAHWGQRP